MNAYDTLARISEPIPAALLSEKSKGGAKLTYCSWFDLCDLLDERCPGWCSEVRVVEGPDPTVICRVTIPTDDGPITREATGTDDEPGSNYGSPLDRAEASALRRAFAKLGLGRELYGGKGAPARQRLHARRMAAEIAAEESDDPAEQAAISAAVERMAAELPPEPAPVEAKPAKGPRGRTAAKLEPDSLAWFEHYYGLVDSHAKLEKIDARRDAAPAEVRDTPAMRHARAMAVARLADAEAERQAALAAEE